MAEPIRSFRDLVAWQCSFALSVLVYRLTASFPADERFGLTSQLRRSAVSAASNIAEGYGRGSKTDYIRFLRIARGSLCEAETQALLASDLQFLKRDEARELLAKVDETKRVLGGLLRSLER